MDGRNWGTELLRKISRKMDGDADSVVVSIAAWHVGGPGSMSDHGMHGIVGVNTWLSTLGRVYLS